jgi:hypothetical protein
MMACLWGLRGAGDAASAVWGRDEVSSILSSLPRRSWACGQGEASRALARAAGEWGSGA